MFKQYIHFNVVYRGRVTTIFTYWT